MAKELMSRGVELLSAISLAFMAGEITGHEMEMALAAVCNEFVRTIPAHRTLAYRYR